jgi:hypothetical protein
VSIGPPPPGAYDLGAGPETAEGRAARFTFVGHFHRCDGWCAAFDTATGEWAPRRPPVPTEAGRGDDGR